MDEFVGERIRTIRLERNLTQEELAEKADISKKYVYEIEQGRKNFSVNILQNIAKALEVSCDYIIFGNK